MTMATTGEQRAQVIYAQAQAVAAHWRTMGMEPSAGSIQAATLDQITAHVARCEELAARYRVTMDPVTLWGQDLAARALGKSRQHAGKRGKKALEARYGTEVAADIIARNKAGRRS